MLIFMQIISMKYSYFFSLILLSFCASTASAQSLAINTDGSTANASALLDVKTTVKGVLIPRMSRSERNAIASPATGLLIFQNAPDSIGFYYYDGAVWAWMFANSNADSLAWKTGGNTGTLPANNFMGTKDNQHVIFKRNNVRAGLLGDHSTSWGTNALNPATTGLNNTAIGVQALQSNIDGANNTALGNQALLNNTAGYWNVSVGRETLVANTTGFWNTAIGGQTMARNTTGYNNTASGLQALFENTTGYWNAATGVQTLVANTSGYWNSAFGGQAMARNTTGYWNTASGLQALFENTTGYWNTASGVQALNWNTDGYWNNASGVQALFNNTNGNTNNAFGTQALYGNTTGYSNVAVGTKALWTNQTGNNQVAIGDSALINSVLSGNTAVGSKAGYFNNGSNNVFLGYQAGYNATGNNKLYIANSSTNPPIIYGDFSNNTLGLGTITPNSTYGYAKVEIASEGYGSPTDLLIRNAVNDPGYAPGLIFQHARGTLATPLTVNNGDYLSAIYTMNYDGSNYVLSAGLDIFADGAIAAGIVPTRLMFNTMNTTGNYAARLTIKNDGKVGIGTTNPSSLLSNNNGSTAGIDGFGLNTNSFNWSMSGAIGYVGGIFNASTGANTSGLVVKVAGTGISNRILDLSTNATQNAPGTPVMIVSGNGTVGIGTGSPISQLANTGTNIIGIDGQGINSPSIAWASNVIGYTAAFYNASSNPIAHGINIKIAGTGTNNRILDLSTSPTQLGVGTSVLVANGNGTVGIGTAAPNSTLQVDGSIAIGTSLNIAGGPSGTPISLLNQKSYVGVLPANATDNYYQLPDPALYAGRTYIIRNNSSVHQANIATAAGLLFPGNSDVGGATYTLNPTSSPKTVMAISDGANWTIMVQN